MVLEFAVFTHEVLREFGTEVLKAAGSSQEEAAGAADCLVLSNLKGVDSHGVRLIPKYVKDLQDGFLKPDVKIRLLNETAVTTYFDGDWGFGYTITREAMEITMKTCRQKTSST